MSCSPALAHQQNLFMDLDYGNCRAMETVEKQTTFSHRSHSAWKTRQPLASFPQFPQSLLLVQHKSKKPNQLIALTNYSCTSNLNRRMINVPFCLLLLPTAPAYCCWNAWTFGLAIPNFFIRDRSVLAWTPSNSAAPPWPSTRQ